MLISQEERVLTIWAGGWSAIVNLMLFLLWGLRRFHVKELCSIAPTMVPFFVWTIMWGKILTCANLMKRGNYIGGLILHVLHVKVIIWSICYCIMMWLGSCGLYFFLCLGHIEWCVRLLWSSSLDGGIGLENAAAIWCGIWPPYVWCGCFEGGGIIALLMGQRFQILS